MNTIPPAGPSVLTESLEREAAREILLWISGQEGLDPEDRIAALEALGALEDFLPPEVVWAPVDERPGTLQDAYRLLRSAARAENTARALTAVQLALGHLRHRLEDR